MQLRQAMFNNKMYCNSNASDYQLILVVILEGELTVVCEDSRVEIWGYFGGKSITVMGSVY